MYVCYKGIYDIYGMIDIKDGWRVLFNAERCCFAVKKSKEKKKEKKEEISSRI